MSADMIKKTSAQAETRGKGVLVTGCSSGIGRAIAIHHVASIHAPDFAVNCLARTLQIELLPWRIPNILVRCGGIKTAAHDKTAQELEAAFKQWPRERFELYAAALKRERGELTAFDEKRTEPEAVARVVFKALSDRKPKRRYRVGHMAGAAAFLELLPQTVVDFVMENRVVR